MSDDNSYEGAVNNVLQGQATLVRNNVYNALPEDPAQVAQHVRIAQTLGLPVESVKYDPKAAQQVAAIQSFDAGKVVRQYPYLAQFLTNPTNAAMSHNDLPTLAATEQAVQNLPRPSPATAPPDLDNSNTGLLSDVWTGLKSTGLKVAGAWDTAAVGLSDLLPDGAPGKMTPAERAFYAQRGQGAIAQGLQSPPQRWTGQVAAGLGYLPFMGAAPFVMAGTEGTAMAQELKSHGVDPSTANTTGAITGALQGAAMFLPMGELSTTGAATFIRSLFTSGAKAGAVGAGQQVASDVVTSQMLKANGYGNIADQYAPSIDRAWDSALFMAGLHLGSQAVAHGGMLIPPRKPPVPENVAVDSLRAQTAVDGQNAMQDLSQNASASELRKNNPDAFHDLIQQMSDGGHLPEVWVDGKTLADALHQSGITPDELQAKLPDVAKQMTEALQTQGDVRISTADFATHIAGGPLEQPLLPHLKTDPDGMTFQQGQEHLANMQQDMQAQAKEIIQDQEAKDERAGQVQAIREELQQRIEATGRFPADIAKQYAALHAAFYDTAAERMGITPAEAAARYPLPDITAHAGAGEHLDQALAAQPPSGWTHGTSGDDLAKLWRGDTDAKAVFLTDLSGKLADEAPTLAPYSHSLSASTVAHIQKNHGDANTEKSRGQLPVSDADIKRIPDIVTNYDALRTDLKTEQGSQRVAYAKRVEDGVLVYLEDVSRKRDDMRGVSMWKFGPTADESTLLHKVLESSAEKEKGQQAGLLDDALRPLSDYESDAQTPPSAGSVEQSGEGFKQGARGAYDPASNTIGLLKDADLSTFLHESGHFFLEKMHEMAQHPDAPEGIKGDFDTLLQHIKVEGTTPEERMAAWTARDLAGKRDGHEQFAEAFEKYLMDGKAPVPELQSLFGRFRAWLMSVYQSLRGDVSPEVRGVMDRMFASQEAIAQAERVRAYAIPDLPSEHGPTIDEYKALGHEATEQAIADMQARSMRDLKWASNAKGRAIEELQRTARDERAKITDEVTKEVMSTPVRAAETALKELKPKTDLERDMLAEQHGFANSAEMDRAIRTAGPVADQIAGITDQRMLERHGELVDPASVERAAEAAIHNEVRAKMMATGLKMFTKSPMSVLEINKAAKAAADTAIAAKQVGDLRPAQYSAAETKANKALLKLAPKDPAGAATAQREALLNNRLFKSASEAVEDVRKGLTYLKRFDKESLRSKIDVDVRDQIDGLLSRFDLRQTPSDAPTRQQLNLEKWIDSQVAAGYSPTVTPEMIDPTFRKPYREMTVEEFRGMIDTVKSMEHMGRERNALMINGEKHDLQEFVRTELVPKLQERGDRFSVDDLYSKPEDRGASPMAVALDHVGSWLRGLNAQLKPQEFKRNDFDRHELLGPFGRALFDPIFDANYNKVRMLKGLSDDFRVRAKELGSDWQKSLHDMLPNDKLIDAIATKEAGVPVYMKISRGKMVGMAIHVGNESNFDKLTKGYGWEPEQVWRFLHDNMTEKDWNAVQHVWDLYEKHWPEMQAMYRRLGQTTPDKIEPRAFYTPFGEMRGGYAAIKYDPLRSRRGEKDAAGEAINPADGLFGRDYFSRATTTNGSMNKRVEGYTDAIDLNFHTIERSLQESIHDLAYREALINANKIIDHPEFRAAFYKAYGREQYRAVQDWIGRIANADNSDRAVGAFGRFLQYTRTGMVMNAIALRATTVLKHGGSAGIKTMGYFTGGGEKYLASRMAAMGSDYSNQIASAKEKFGEINARLLQQDRDYRATASSMFEPESLTSRAERFGHAAVAWSDMMTAVPTAWAAYDRAITEGVPVRQGGTGQPMTEAQAVAYANKVVREAHGSNVESARSNIMTAPSEGLKMFTTLYGFMNNSYGQMADSINKVMTPGIGTPEVLARTFMAIIVPALWAGYLAEGGAKDDESWAVWAGKAITGEVAAMVPVVRDAYSMVQGYRHAGVIGAEAWAQTLVQPFIDAAKLATGHDVHGVVSHTADALGMGLHIPGLGQLGKSAQYAADVQSGKQHPENSLEYVKGLTVGAHHK